MQVYKEEDYLLLSGIQHFAFCRRQWALIHLEQQWEENSRTMEGNFFHERAHAVNEPEKRGELLIVRGMPVFSRTLGVSGVCDVVEFHQDAAGISLFGREGLWLPIPVEYKRGRPKEHNADALQLCLQAMCLEEMLLCKIGEGYLFYGETRRRTIAGFDETLRRTVCEMLAEMHTLWERRFTPKVKPSKSCKACSLVDICMPMLCRKRSAKDYIAEMVGNGEESE